MNFEKTLKWYQTNLRPRCDDLVQLIIKKAPEKDKEHALQRFYSCLQKLDNMLNDLKAPYFSGSEEVSVLDMMYHCEITTIVCMYTNNNRLRNLEYRYLSPWMDKMAEFESVNDNLQRLKEIVIEKNYKHELMPS